MALSLLQLMEFPIGVMAQRTVQCVSLVIAPVFLVWKMGIDVLSVCGVGRSNSNARNEECDTVANKHRRDSGIDDGRIKVLFLMIQMAMGGAERLVFNLIKHLDRGVFAPSLGWFVGERPLKEFEELGIPLHYIPKQSRFDFGAMRAIGRIVREEGIDVINAHHFTPFVYAYYGGTIANRGWIADTEHSKAMSLPPGAAGERLAPTSCVRAMPWDQ